MRLDGLVASARASASALLTREYVSVLLTREFGFESGEGSTARANAALLGVGCGAFAVCAGLAIAPAAGSLPVAVQLVPLFVSVVAFGLPHGAVDHLVLPRSRNEAVTRRSIAAVCGLYLVLGGGYALVWFVEPVAAFAAFVLLTILHWGQGDVYALVELTGVSHLRTRVDRTLALLVRGGIPMLVPLVAFPDQYAFVTHATVGLFDSAATAALEPIFEPAVRRWIGLGFGSLVAVTLVRGYRRTEETGPWLLDAGETVGLVALFAFVPPILAIGLYFPFWHSIRHVLRTLLVDEPAVDALDRGDLRGAAGRFYRDAAPTTIGALVVLAGLALLVPQTPATLPDLLGIYLVCLAVLTLPHAVIVSLLDGEQGIWSTSST